MVSFGVFGSFWSLKQVKNEGEFCETLENRFPSQSRDARKKIRERNPTWSNFAWLCAIQKDSSCKTNLEHFIESIIYILSIISKLGKSRVQRFKQCANWSWNEEVMVIWRQLHQVGEKFRNPLRNWGKWISQPFFSLAKVSQPCEIFFKSSDIFASTSLDFLSQDILYNYLVSPCNHLKIFLDI